MRTATVDSSALINLTHLNLVRKLSLFFDRVYVPRAVQIEVNKKGRFRYRLNKLYHTSILRRCTGADEVHVDLLRAENVLDSGEAEAIIQAQEQGAAVLLADERRARDVVHNMGMKAVGTLRILARLQRDGEAPDLGGMVEKLRRERHFRVSDELISAAVGMANEPV